MQKKGGIANVVTGILLIHTVWQVEESTRHVAPQTVISILSTKCSYLFTDAKIQHLNVVLD